MAWFLLPWLWYTRSVQFFWPLFHQDLLALQSLVSCSTSYLVTNGASFFVVSCSLIVFLGSFLWLAFEIATGTNYNVVLFPFVRTADQLTALGSLQDQLLRACLILFATATAPFVGLCLLCVIALMTHDSRVASWNAILNWLWKHAPWHGQVIFLGPQCPSLW